MLNIHISLHSLVNSLELKTNVFQLDGIISDAMPSNDLAREVKNVYSWVLMRSQTCSVSPSLVPTAGRRIPSQRRLQWRRSASGWEWWNLHVGLFQWVQLKKSCFQNKIPHKCTVLHEARNKSGLPNVCPSSGLPVQLDRVLPVLLPDQYHRRTLRGHLWLRPLPHQVDSYRQGMLVFLLTRI